jgi:hypothetical protein
MLPGLISESYKTAGPARVEIPFDMTGGYYNPMGMDPEMADPDYDDARMAAAGPGGAAGIVAAAAAGPVGGGIFMDENIYAPVAPLPAPLLEPSPVPQGTATLDNEKFLKDLGPIDDYDRYVAMMTESQKTDAAGKVLADFLAAWNAYKTATSSYGRTMNLDAMKLSLRKFYRLGKIEQLEIAKKMLRDVIGQ